MNERCSWKIFARFWTNLAMIQFDMYHSYTVDEHTIKAIGVLHEISVDIFRMRHHWPQRLLAILSLEGHSMWQFCCMTPKGRGGDHSIAGSKVAANLCPRLGLTSEETKQYAGFKGNICS